MFLFFKYSLYLNSYLSLVSRVNKQRMVKILGICCHSYVSDG